MAVISEQVFSADGSTKQFQVNGNILSTSHVGIWVGEVGAETRVPTDDYDVLGSFVIFHDDAIPANGTEVTIHLTDDGSGIEDNPTNIDIVAGATYKAQIETVADNISGISDVFAELNGSNNIATVADDLNGTNTIGTVATDIANVNTVATDIANVNVIGSKLTADDDIEDIADDIQKGTYDFISTYITTGDVMYDRFYKIVLKVYDNEDNLLDTSGELEVGTGGGNMTMANINAFFSNSLDTRLNSLTFEYVGKTAPASSSANKYYLQDTSKSFVGKIELFDAWFDGYDLVTPVLTINPDGSLLTSYSENGIIYIDLEWSNIEYVANRMDDIARAVAVASDISVVSNNITDISTTSSISGDITTVSTNITNINTVAGIDTDIITTVSSNYLNINAVADNETNINSAVSNETNINAVVANQTNINAVANASDDISTVASIGSDVSLVADNETKVTTVATNIADINNVSNVITEGANAIAPNNGYLGAKALSTFSVTVGNKYKLLDNQEYRKVNGNIITASSGATIDLSNGGNFPFDVNIETTTTTTVSYTVGDYAVIDNDIYRCILDSTSGTLTTNTTYFEDRTQYGITNKYLATMKDDGTVKTEVCLVDTDIKDCKNAHIVMTDNGYSKLANGLYSKGSDVVAPIGTWSTLNKGAFHPIYNYFGTNYWENTNGTSVVGILTDSPYANSTAGAFYIGTNGNSGIRVDSSNNLVDSSVSVGNNAHPQGKYYDIIYPDQWIDLRISANAVSEQDELNRVGTKAKSGQLDGIGGVVALELYGTVTTVNTSASATLYSPVGFVPDNVNLNQEYDARGWYVEIVDGKSIYTNGSFIPCTIYATNNSNDWVKLLSTIPASASGIVYKLYKTKIIPHPSSGTALRPEVLANPTSYSQKMKDVLASGNPLMFTPNLVDDTGASNIPDGSKTVFKLNNKVTTAHQVLKSTDSGVTWTLLTLTTHYTVNAVTNTITFVTAPLATDMIIVSNTAKIPATQVSEPKAVKLVGNYVTGTNSHSIYKGNQLVPTGKVNVGNGDNGLESRVVENAILFDMNVTRAEGTFDLITNSYVLRTSDCTAGTLNHIYFYNGASILGIAASTLTFNTTYYFDQGAITTPDHSTISLDNSNSPAVKFIETIAEDDDGMAHYQVFAQEMVWDYSLDTATDNLIVSNANVECGIVNDGDRVLFKGYIDSMFNNMIVVVNASLASLLSQGAYLSDYFSPQGQWYLLDNIVGRYINGSFVKYGTLWDGNGFGDDNQFSQLTNGTLTDDNANTVKTIVASIPLNKYIGDE